MPTPVRSNVLTTLIERRSWSAVLARLENHPQEASEELTRGIGTSLALHEACKLQPPVNVVRGLIAAYSAAVHTPGPFGCLPLHIALKAGGLPDVVDALIAEYPPSVRIREPTGKLPLHIACQYGASPETVNVVLMHHPQAIIVKDEEGYRPVEYATRQKFCPNQEADVVRVLDRAKWYCAVSSAAALRASVEFETRISTLESDYAKQLSDARAECEEVARQSAEAEAAARRREQVAIEEVDQLKTALRGCADKEAASRRKMSISLEEMRDKVEAEKIRCRELERQLKDKESELAEQEGQHAEREGELVATLTNLEDTIQIVTAEAKQLKAKMQSQENLSKVVADLEERLRDITEEKDDLREKMSEAVKDLEARLGDITDERDNLREKAASLELCIKHLEKELKRTRDDYRSCQSDLRKARNESKDLEEELEVFMNDKKELEDKVDHLTYDKMDLEKRLGVLLGDKMDLEKRLGVLLGDKADLEAKLMAAENENKIRWDASEILLTRVQDLEREVESVSADGLRESAEYELRIKGLEALLDQANDRAERGLAVDEGDDREAFKAKRDDAEKISESNGQDTDEGRDDVAETGGTDPAAASASAVVECEPSLDPSIRVEDPKSPESPGGQLMVPTATKTKAKKKISDLFTINNQSWVSAYITP